MKASGADGVAGNAARLAIGTLTVLPVRAPRRVDRPVAAWAMVLAPAVGALLAAPAGAALWLLGPVVGPALTAALVVGLLATATRAMHLDGLADTVDGLGSGRPAEQALDIMRRGDVGPFGVVALVLVLLVQVLALAHLVDAGIALGALLLALVVSRLALPLLCSAGIPAARPDGLGSAVAGSVSPAQLAVSVLLAAAAGGVPALAAIGTALAEPAVALRIAGVVLVGLASAAIVLLQAVRRLGGVTGDVLGAAVEVSFTAVLVAVVAVT